MSPTEALLINRWILKRKDAEMYYKVKDDAKNLRKYFLDNFGYSLLVHSDFVRLDKVPGKAEPWMGINEFNSVEEYQLFCYVLMFLEEKDNEEQFILSNLCEYLQIQLKTNEEYWNQYSRRKKLVNVLKFCLQESLIIQNDGDTDSFAQSEDIEVLFESTGLSRYFMRSFTMNVFEKEKPEELMQEEWERDEDRGDARKHRIYRRLLLSLGIYQENKNLDDFDYIRRFRKSIQKDFQHIAPYEFQVQKSSSYMVLDEEDKFGETFPKNNAMHELVILVFSYLRKRIKNKDLQIDESEFLALDETYVQNTIQRIIKKENEFLPNTLRKKKLDALSSEVLEEMIMLGLAWKDEGQVVFAPAIGKWHGYFKEEKEHGTK